MEQVDTLCYKFRSRFINDVNPTNKFNDAVVHGCHSVNDLAIFFFVYLKYYLLPITQEDLMKQKKKYDIYPKIMYIMNTYYFIK